MKQQEAVDESKCNSDKFKPTLTDTLEIRLGQSRKQWVQRSITLLAVR